METIRQEQAEESLSYIEEEKWVPLSDIAVKISSGL